MAALYGAQTPLRRDAQRNRAAIVEAAIEAMTTQQPTVGIPEIARRAGVGQATLYRHFPDRGALADAVFACLVERLAACVAAVRADPAGFRRVLDEILRSQISMRPLVLLARRLEPAVQRRLLRRITALLAEPLRRAQEHGYVRSDLTPDDLPLLFSMVEGVVDSSTDLGAAGRCVDLALNGVFRAAA